MELEDSKGNLWFSTDVAGAFMYDGKSFTHFTKSDGLCSNTVWSIVEVDDGNILVRVHSGRPTYRDQGRWPLHVRR